MAIENTIQFKAISSIEKLNIEREPGLKIVNSIKAQYMMYVLIGVFGVRFMEGTWNFSHNH